MSWNVDKAHSSISFKIRHMMFAKVRGAFEQWDATLSFDPEHPAQLQTQATIQIDSITTSNADRDNHLKSPDFFDAANFPTMTFTSTHVEANGDALKLHGDLTIRGNTQKVALDVDFAQVGKDPWGNERVGFSATTTINRKDFGLTWNQAVEAGGVLVGEKVDIELELQFVKA